MNDQEAPGAAPQRQGGDRGAHVLLPRSRRVALVDPAAVDEPLRSVLERVGSSMGRVPNLHRCLAVAPELVERWCEFSETVRSAADVPRGVRELAILRTAIVEGAEYVWRSHVVAARAAGVAGEKISELADWHPSPSYSRLERAALALADEMSGGGGAGSVTDGTWTELVAVCSPSEAVELVVTIGWYACVTRVTVALDVPLEDGHAQLPPLPQPGANR